MEGPFLRGGPRPIRAFCVSDPKISSTEVDSLRHRSTLAPCRLGVPNRNAGWCCSRVLPDRISEKHRRLATSLWFRSVEGALGTIAGYEAMNMIRKGQIRWLAKGDITGQVHYIEQIFGIAA